MVDLKEELEDIENFEDKLKFLNEKFKETEDKDLRKEIIELFEKLISEKKEELSPEDFKDLEFSMPNDVFIPTFRKEELEDILEPVVTGGNEVESVNYSGNLGYDNKKYSTTDMNDTTKKYDTQGNYQTKFKNANEVRQELEENSRLDKQSKSEDISEKLKKEKKGFI